MKLKQYEKAEVALQQALDHEYGMTVINLEHNVHYLFVAVDNNQSPDQHLLFFNYVAQGTTKR